MSLKDMLIQDRKGIEMLNVEVLVTDGPGSIVFHGIIPEVLADFSTRGPFFLGTTDEIQVQDFVMPSRPGVRYVRAWRWADLPCEVRHG